MASYTWDPLLDPKAWIRILTLEAGSVNQPLTGSLEAVPIESRPIYEATSYCVGLTDTPCQIELRQGGAQAPLNITNSLFNMLQRFRSPVKARRLWVDAICIDQTNDDERADQVFLMYQIYTMAQRALIYLGEPDETTPKAIELLHRLFKAAMDSSTSLDLGIIAWQRHHQIPLVTEPWKWESLKDFFCRPWFSRKWTIQECVLAPETVFHCGAWEVDWEFMSVVQKTIWDRGLAVSDHTNYSKVEMRQQLQHGLAQFGAMGNFRRAFLHGTKYQLMDAIYSFQNSRATDLRDHLFALLGLANDSGDEELRPMYKDATILDNCLRYAYHFLRKKGNLEVLYRAGKHGHKLLAPSWVPNWYGKPVEFGSDYAPGPWDPLQRPAFYNVARGTQADIKHTADRTVLGVKGVVIDKVKILANRHLKIPVGQNRDKNFLLAQNRRRQEENEEIASKLNSYPAGESSATAFWKTLICGITLSREKASDDVYAPSYQAWRKCLRNDFKDRSDMTQTRQRQVPFREATDAFNGNKIFGVTESGYFGMFSTSTEEGDLIAVFYGGEFPFIIRPRAGKAGEDVELVGQCYIHGIMEEGQFNVKDHSDKAQYFYLGGNFEVEPPFQPGGVIPS